MLDGFVGVFNSKHFGATFNLILSHKTLYKAEKLKTMYFDLYKCMKCNFDSFSIDFHPLQEHKITKKLFVQNAPLILPQEDI